MANQVVTPDNLGKTIKAAAIVAGKYDVNIDNSSIMADANGVLSVDSSNISVVVVSADAGQVLVAGSDAGALLTKEMFQDLVGDMVANATDGLTYDDAIGALTAAVASAIGTDTASVDISVSLSAAGALSIKAAVKISAVADNILVGNADGLYVSGNAIASATTNEHKVITDEAFITTVNGVPAKSKLVEVTDAFGVHLGDMFSE